MSKHALSVQSLVLKAKSKTILDELSFEVARGEAFAVVGHNGAGKTSLFQTALGFRFAAKGTIAIDGIPSLDRRARLKIGYVPERPYFSTDAGFSETLQMMGSLSGMSPAQIHERQELLKKQLGLVCEDRQKLKSFSKGMLQKTLLIQALLHNPDILILDEPMSGLDPKSRAEFKNFLIGLKKLGKTLVFSSHAVEDVRQLADRVLELEKGKRRYLGKTQDWNTDFSAQAEVMSEDAST